MKDLTTGNEAKVILLFSLPMLLGNIFQQLYNTVDSMIVGRHLGKESLAAVGASFPVIFFLTALTMGISMGSTIQIAQYYGAKDMDRVKTVSYTHLDVYKRQVSFVSSNPTILICCPMLRNSADPRTATIVVSWAGEGLPVPSLADSLPLSLIHI